MKFVVYETNEKTWKWEVPGFCYSTDEHDNAHECRLAAQFAAVTFSEALSAEIVTE